MIAKKLSGNLKVEKTRRMEPISLHLGEGFLRIPRGDLRQPCCRVSRGFRRVVPPPPRQGAALIEQLFACEVMPDLLVPISQELKRAFEHI